VAGQRGGLRRLPRLKPLAQRGVAFLDQHRRIAAQLLVQAGAKACRLRAQDRRA